VPLVVLHSARGSSTDDLRGKAWLYYGNAVKCYMDSGEELRTHLDGRVPKIVLLSNAAGHFQATEPSWTENGRRSLAGGASPG